MTSQADECESQVEREISIKSHELTCLELTSLSRIVRKIKTFIVDFYVIDASKEIQKLSEWQICAKKQNKKTNFQSEIWNGKPVGDDG